MQHTPYVEVPIYARDKSIRAHFLIDAADHAMVTQYRWSLSGGYVRRCRYDSGKQESVHLARWLMGLEKGDPLTVDHINRNPLDNRRDNLRIITMAAQCQNRKKPGISGLRGVTQSRDRWQASCWINGKKHYLGVFKDKDEAGRVAREFRLAHMPYAVD